MFWDHMNELEDWPLGRLILKTHNLQHLKIAYLSVTTDENRRQLLELAAQAATFSTCLQSLHI